MSRPTNMEGFRDRLPEPRHERVTSHVSFAHPRGAVVFRGRKSDCFARRYRAQELDCDDRDPSSLLAVRLKSRGIERASDADRETRLLSDLPRESFLELLPFLDRAARKLPKAGEIGDPPEKEERVPVEDGGPHADPGPQVQRHGLRSAAVRFNVRPAR